MAVQTVKDFSSQLNHALTTKVGLVILNEAKDLRSEAAWQDLNKV